ncbi:MAG: hypothetical protein IKU86_06195 [Thermoguttaceae bacterium]|nr:hypothetical protein [Thermoguttaceae bacterium]
MNRFIWGWILGVAATGSVGFAITWRLETELNETRARLAESRAETEEAIRLRDASLASLATSERGVESLGKRYRAATKEIEALTARLREAGVEVENDGAASAKE